MKKVIPSQLVNPSGLHEKYFIQKIVKVKNEHFNPSHKISDLNEPYRLERRNVDSDAEYFVLRLDRYGSDLNHISACRIGIHAYADAIESSIPQLAKDLRERYPLVEQALKEDKGHG